MSYKIVRIHPKDNVLVALSDLQKGESIEFENKTYILQNDIPGKHKFASEELKAGTKVYMYGVLVAKTLSDIPKGGALTTQNIAHAAGSYDVEAGKTEYNWEAPSVSEWKGRTFNGFHRTDGKVGTANYWLVIPLVFCENRNVGVLKELLENSLGYGRKETGNFDIGTLISSYQKGASIEEVLANDILVSSEEEKKKNSLFPNVDGIKFLTHNGGCGGTREDAEVLCRLIAGYINNPNVAGATVLSLGCQNAEDKLLEQAIKDLYPNSEKPLYILEQQSSTSEKDFISEAVKKTFGGLMMANELKRKPASLDKLVIGLECGGSDGFSGISANPVLGGVSDLVVALGGSTVLAEFPELNGVEQELINRCVEDEAATKFSNLMATYNTRAEEVGSGFHANPSPGNIKDGLITDAMKSAGAAKKGGTSPVQDVLDYTEPVKKPGLSLLCTPGNDVESTTGLAGSGTNMILFTTGLGTPTGNPVCPVLKVSSNSKLFNRMNDIMDFNTGEVIEGKVTIEQSAGALLDLIVKVASGDAESKAMRLGQDDFIPWKRGVSL